VPAPASPGPASPAEPPSGTPIGRVEQIAAAEQVATAEQIARVALVVGTTAGGTGTHVRMLAAGFAERGSDVSVLGPSSADAAFGFGAVAGVTFSPVEFGDREIQMYMLNPQAPSSNLKALYDAIRHQMALDGCD